MEHFLGIEDERFNEYMLLNGASAGLTLSSVTAPLLRAHNFRGLALLHFNRTTKALGNLSNALPVSTYSKNIT